MTMKFLQNGKSQTYLVLRKRHRLGHHFWKQKNKINNWSSSLHVALHKHLKREGKWTTHTVAYKHRQISSSSLTLLTNSGESVCVHRLPTQRQLNRDRLHGLVFQWGFRARKNCCPVIWDKYMQSPSGQVTFHSHLPFGKGSDMLVCQLNYYNSKLRLAQGKQNVRATCPKGRLKLKFFQVLEDAHLFPLFYEFNKLLTQQPGTFISLQIHVNDIQRGLFSVKLRIFFLKWFNTNTNLRLQNLI